MITKGGVDLVAAYLAWLTLRGLASTTIKRRTSSLHAWQRWLYPLPPERAGREHVEDWLTQWSRATTRKAYRSDLSDFYAWAARRELVDRNPVALTDRIRTPKTLPRPIRADAVPAIIAAAPTGTLRVALMLAAYAGLRRAEICALDAADVQLAPEPLLVVRGGKGARDRVVPVHPALAAELERHPSSGRLVPWCPDHLGTVAAAHIRACGYDASLHKLRASFATEAARVLRGDLVTVGSLLGHADPATTMAYVRLGLAGDTGTKMRQLYAVA